MNLPRAVPRPVFVKVGANDGVTADPISDVLLARKAWRGLLVEPVPYCFERLKRNFQGPRFSLEQAAIGPSPGEVSFYYVDERATKDLQQLPQWFNQLGSFDRSHIVKHLDGCLEPYIVECAVPVYPLSHLLSKHNITHIDLLHIDTEGYDYEVLKSLDLSNQLPLAVYIEHQHLTGSDKKSMQALLADCDYSVMDCGADYFAMHASVARMNILRRIQFSSG